MNIPDLFCSLSIRLSAFLRMLLPGEGGNLSLVRLRGGCFLVAAITLGPLAAEGQEQASPQLPLILWDVNFNDDSPGLPPRGASKEEMENQLSGSIWKRFPQRTYNALLWVTPTRVASVETEAFGLSDKPVVFRYDEASHPHYGPQLYFQLPKEIIRIGKVYRLSFDLAKGDTTQAGGVTLGDVGSIMFDEMGNLLINRSPAVLYQPATPIHFDILINTVEKTTVYTIDGDEKEAVRVPWTQPNGAFSVVRLEGLLTGGYARVPGKIAFDNIKLLLEKLQ